MKETMLRANKFDGWSVTVDVEGNTQEYAMALLHIFNNVRESHALLNVANSYDNTITVYCREDSKDALVEYLKNFGESTACEMVLCWEIKECWIPERDYEKYSDEIVVPYIE